jgi:hypothetical protein
VCHPPLARPGWAWTGLAEPRRYFSRRRPVPRLGFPSNDVGHIIGAESEPGAGKEPRTGQEADPHPLGAHIYEGPHLARLGSQGLGGGRQVRPVAGVEVAHRARRAVHLELPGTGRRAQLRVRNWF